MQDDEVKIQISQKRHRLYIEVETPNLLITSLRPADVSYFVKLRQEPAVIKDVCGFSDWFQGQQERFLFQLQ